MGVGSEHEQPERRLLLVPVVHTAADFGTLAGQVGEVKRRTFGEEAWKRSAERLERFWDEIEETVLGWPLDPARVRLFQDSLPVCGRELDIVRDLAAKGSRNHSILMTLVERGATLAGTESPALLIEEFQLVRRQLESGRVDADHAARLLEKRDRFVGSRVSDTLLPGETGILFMGLLHRVERFFAADIHVECPFAHEREARPC